MEITVISYVGAGDIRFGMSPDEVRAILDDESVSFMKSRSSSLPTDSFFGDSIHVFYKPPGACEAVEFYKPANPVLEGQTFVSKKFELVREWILRRDPAVEIEDGSLISYKLGVGLYVPAIGGPDAVVESLIAFEKGYYG